MTAVIELTRMSIQNSADQRPRKQKRRFLENEQDDTKRRRCEDGDSDSEDEIRQAYGFWPSWLILEGADDQMPLSGLHAFAVARGVLGIAGELKLAKKLKLSISP